jgi:hypothetical protein
METNEQDEMVVPSCGDNGNVIECVNNIGASDLLLSSSSSD